MPAVPLGERLVALVDMALRLVLILLLSAYCALRERRNDYAPGEIIEIQRLAVASLEDRQARLCQDSHAESVRFERVRQLLDDGDACPAALRFRLICNPTPSGVSFQLLGKFLSSPNGTLDA